MVRKWLINDWKGNCNSAKLVFLKNTNEKLAMILNKKKKVNKLWNGNEFSILLGRSAFNGLNKLTYLELKALERIKT